MGQTAETECVPVCACARARVCVCVCAGQGLTFAMVGVQCVQQVYGCAA